MSIEYEIESLETDDAELSDTTELQDESDAPGTDKADKADPVEAVAVELGWNPDFEGDGKVDAKTYILKSREIQDTMREHIKEQKGQLHELADSVTALKTHNEKVYKAEVTRLKTELEDLRRERREAIEEGDVDKVDELDERIDGVEESITKPDEKPRSTAEFDAWIADNKWYDEDDEMAAYADAIASENRGAPFARVAALVDRKVKEMFPDKFAEQTTPAATPQKQKSPSPVEESGTRPQVAKFTKADLSEGQKAIMAQFVRQGIMTEKQYIADIAKTQGVA